MATPGLTRVSSIVTKGYNEGGSPLPPFGDQVGLGIAERVLLDGAPANYFRRNIDRRWGLADLAALTTQVMLTVALPLFTGDVVTKLAFKSGATAAGTPTNWWFALYDPDGALIGQTADQTSTAWAASTAMDVALAAPYTATRDGVYYAGVMVKATTPPSLLGVSTGVAAGSGAWVTGEKVLAQTSGSSLTTTAPATIATPTTVVNVPLVVAH